MKLYTPTQTNMDTSKIDPLKRRFQSWKLIILIPPLNFGGVNTQMLHVWYAFYTYLHWVKNGHIQAKCTSIYHTWILRDSFLPIFGISWDASLAIFPIWDPMFQSFRSILLEVSPHSPKLQVDKLGPLKKTLHNSTPQKKKKRWNVHVF